MKKRRLFPDWIYVILEGALFIALLVFQCLSIASGYRIYGQESPYYAYIGAFQISLTALTFLFGLYVFLSHRKNPKTRFDLFLVYFLFILIADIFFSVTPIPLGGHIGFLSAYVLFFFLRKARWYEGIVALVGGAAALIVFAVIGKLTPLIGVDCFLGALLICNVVAMWIRFGKNKEKHLLPACIALSLLLLSDGSIALRTFTSSFPANHILAMITWPTYVIADVLLAFWYLDSKEKESTSK